MAAITKEEWTRVWNVVVELTEDHDDMVLIGGVAVYVHTEAYNTEYKSRDITVEFTHDADMAISMPTLGQLRDEHEVVVNKRLGKRQITVDGVEVDIYVANQSGLRIKYDDLAELAVDVEGVPVACLGHLLLLKLDALDDRWSSSHGDKDRRDVAKLMVMLHVSDDEPSFDAVVDLATSADLKLMKRVVGSSAFIDLAKKNSQTASRLRKKAEAFLEDVVDNQDES